MALRIEATSGSAVADARTEPIPVSPADSTAAARDETAMHSIKE